MDELIFYTYVYLDPRKPGLFVYEDAAFAHEPFYVGKGNNGRAFDHLKDHHLNKSENYRASKIKKIRKETGTDPIIQFYKKDISEAKAFELEKWLIATIGRKDKGLGPLTNFTDSGEGSSGWIPSNEWREKHSGKNNWLFNNPFLEETKRKISEKAKSRYANGQVPHNKGQSHTEATKAKMRKPKVSTEKMLGAGSSDAHRIAVSKAISEYRKSHPPWNKGLTKEIDPRVSFLRMRGDK